MNSHFALHTSGLAELMAFCEALTWPATEHDRRTFEALFRYVSADLSAPEIGEAERLARHVFPGLEGLPIAQEASK